MVFCGDDRREVRRQVEPLLKTSAAYRRDVAALNVRLLHSNGALAPWPPAFPSTGWLVSRRTDGLSDSSQMVRPRSLRARRSVSAAKLTLMGVSARSAFNWEHKKTTPRKEQLATLVALRRLSKRDVSTCLAARKSQVLEKRRRGS